jgi:hypothetical protein
MLRGGAPDAVRTPSFRRVPEQITSHGGDAFTHRVLNEPFQVARAEQPGLTLEQFLARVDPDSALGRVIDELLGPAQATLLRTTDPGQFERALVDHYRTFRHGPPPYDAGVSYARHRYLDGAHVDLRQSRLLVVPPNAPVFSQVENAFRYPSWDVGRARANQSVAAVQLSRVLGRDVPLDKGGRELFDALNLDHSVETFDCYLDPELRLSALQWAFTMATGYAPIYRSVLASGAAPSGKGLKSYAARTATQAQWELASRLGTPELIDAPAEALRHEWDRARKAGGASVRPTATAAQDAFTEASTDDLFSMALREPDAPKVYVATPEWEHHRSQRLAGRLDKLAVTLQVPDAWRSRFRMLAGLCEPENLHFLMPWMHAAEDLFAGGFAPVRQRIWQDGSFNAGAFLVNRSRVDRWGNVMVPTDFASHPDLPRAKNALVAYTPRDLVALLTSMQEDTVLRAARDLAGEDVRMWNALADQLNAAARALEMSPALSLPLMKPKP